MVSSYWVNINPNIKTETTKKQYFNRYLWRLVYSVKRVYLATDKRVYDVLDHVCLHRQREQNAKKYPGGYSSSNYSYDPYRYRRDNWEGVDEVLIDRIRTVTKTFKDVAKFRTEWNTLQVYAETEEDLKRIAEAISHNESITHVTIPKPGTEDSLRNGCVFMGIGTDFKYKIILRDGNYDTHIKNSILEQLKQRDDVKIPSHLRRELTQKYPALWGAYFYTNDDSIVTILSLLSPGIVGKIHPIDHLQ